MGKNIAAIICAAGAGTRFGGKRKKPFIDVAGRPAFIRSIELFSERKDVKQVLVAIQPEDEEMVKINWGANLNFFGVKIYLGGRERFETVQKGLDLLKDDIDLVAIHDAVRCCTKKEWIDECLAAAEKTGAAILACPVVSTLKRVESMLISATIDRENLWEAQTPQIFDKNILKNAYKCIEKFSDKSKISDDSQLVEAMGHKVSIVETDFSNIKITRPADLQIAEAIIKSMEKKSVRPLGAFEEAQW